MCGIFTHMDSQGVPSAMNVVPTYWVTIMGFFFTYLFINALRLYKKQETSKAPASSVAARKSQSMTSMIIIIAVGIIFAIMRYATSCETMLGMILGSLLGGSIAYGWNKFMKRCGLGRLDDLFGISNRILPLQSYEETEPTVCVPTSSSSD